MAKILAGLLSLALLPSALAFQNTSPFFLFSTTDPRDFITSGAVLNHQVASAKHLTQELRGVLGAACPSSVYIVVQRDGVSSADVRDQSFARALAKYMADGSKPSQLHKTRISVPEVVGRIDTDKIVDTLVEKCGAEVVKPQGIDEAKFSRESPIIITVSERDSAAQTVTASNAEMDKALETILSRYRLSADYMVLYTTAPKSKEPAPSAHNEHPYEMEDPFGDAVRMELKRDTAFAPRADQTNDGGLFEKYQFFTPGLFMAFSAMVPLVIILGVALRAIANLEVSYFAFSKEMGPTAQKKQ